MKVYVEVTALYVVEVETHSVEAAVRAVEANWDSVYKHQAKADPAPALLQPHASIKVVGTDAGPFIPEPRDTSFRRTPELDAIAKRARREPRPFIEPVSLGEVQDPTLLPDTKPFVDDPALPQLKVKEEELSYVDQGARERLAARLRKEKP